MLPVFAVYVGFIGFAVGLAALGTRLRLGCGPEYTTLPVALQPSDVALRTDNLQSEDHQGDP